MATVLVQEVPVGQMEGKRGRLNLPSVQQGSADIHIYIPFKEPFNGNLDFPGRRICLQQSFVVAVARGLASTYGPSWADGLYNTLGATIPYYTILYYTILYYTILYYTILYYTILYYTILYYTILYYTILYYTILYYTILYYTILYHTILYYTILYYTILYYTILYYTILYYTILY